MKSNNFRPKCWLKLGLDEFTQIVIPFQMWTPRFSNKWGKIAGLVGANMQNCWLNKPSFYCRQCARYYENRTCRTGVPDVKTQPINPTFDHNPKHLSSIIWIKYDSHLPNTPSTDQQSSTWIMQRMMVHKREASRLLNSVCVRPFWQPVSATLWWCKWGMWPAACYGFWHPAETSMGLT